jgi:chemotaxis protein methyltransferase CheR
MIYFPPDNRLKILDSLVNALKEKGILILGVSETSSVEHPLLESKNALNLFYFQKKGAANRAPVKKKHGADSEPRPAQAGKPPAVPDAEKLREETTAVEKPAGDQGVNQAVKPALNISGVRGTAAGRAAMPDMREISALLENQDGQPNARKAADVLEAEETADTLKESELIAAAVTFLGAEDFGPAEKVIASLERISGAAAVSFLRAEYCYLGNNMKAAEEKYQEASLADKAFWPAFYRLSSLAAEGNRTRYEYRIKKAVESMEVGKDRHYEIFIGGFSPDYYRHILERKLIE